MSNTIIQVTGTPNVPAATVANTIENLRQNSADVKKFIEYLIKKGVDIDLRIINGSTYYDGTPERGARTTSLGNK